MARSALNATRHGAFAVSPVVPQLGESEADWNGFRDAVQADLAPVGPVELMLAGRVASLLWRMQRVERAEARMHGQWLADVGWEAGDNRGTFNDLLNAERAVRDGPREAEECADRSVWTREHYDNMQRLEALAPADPVDAADAGLVIEAAPAVEAGAGPEPDPARPEGWTRAQFDDALGVWLGPPRVTPSPGHGDLLAPAGPGWLSALAAAARTEWLAAIGAAYRANIRAERLTVARSVLDGGRFERLAAQDTHLARSLSRTLAELRGLQARRA